MRFMLCLLALCAVIISLYYEPFYFWLFLFRFLFKAEWVVLLIRQVIMVLVIQGLSLFYADVVAIVAEAGLLQVP